MTIEYREPVLIEEVMKEFFDDLEEKQDTIKKDVQDKDKILL